MRLKQFQIFGSFFIWAFCAIAPHAYGAPSIRGVWTSSEGDITWSGTGKATYTNDEGRLIGSFDGTTFRGYWIEKGSARTCDSKKDGSLHWGKVEFKFNADLSVFNGAWGYCNAAPSSGWSGKKKGIVPVKPETQTASAQNCLALEEHTRKRSEVLRKTWADWGGLEQDYLNFYDASKFEMSSDFDKIYYEVPGIIPFHKTLNRVFKVEKNQHLRHFPRIKITAPPDYRSQAAETLDILGEIASGAGPIGAPVSGIISNITKWDTFLGQGNREQSLPFDEGITKYRSLMRERQKTLDNFRTVITGLYCKKVIARERELFVLRTQRIAQSQCPAHVKEALTGFAVRHSKYRNAEQFRTVDHYCKSIGAQ